MALLLEGDTSRGGTYQRAEEAGKNWWLEALKKYAVFDGRARRKEYWMFALFNSLVALAWAVEAIVFGVAPENQGLFVAFFWLPTLYSLAILLPSLAVMVRRLHDTDHSGWWTLISLVPLVGGIVLLVYLARDSDPSPNRYGPNPKGVLRSPQRQPATNASPSS